MQGQYETTLSFRCGLELELVLDHNHSKWALLFEPTYQSYRANAIGASSIGAEVNYKSIELPVGMRHYLFSNKISKLFTNASVVYDLPINATVGRLKVTSSLNYALGIGYRLMETYGVELRYQTHRELLNSYNSYTSDYTSLAVIFAYTLF